MPYAKRRVLAELNKAYAHIAEPVFAEAAKSLVDKLIEMGFDDAEARETSRASNTNSTTTACLRRARNQNRYFVGLSRLGPKLWRRYARKLAKLFQCGPRMTARSRLR